MTVTSSEWLQLVIEVDGQEFLVRKHVSEEELDMYVCQIGWLELPDLNKSHINLFIVYNNRIKWCKWTYKHDPKRL